MNFRSKATVNEKVKILKYAKESVLYIWPAKSNKLGEFSLI